MDPGTDRQSGATCFTYTAKPTALGSVGLDGTIWSGPITSPLTNVADATPSVNTVVNFTQLFGKPIILDDESESLNWNMAGATVANGGVTMLLLAGATWFEV
jgi:hypothetical protein